MTVGELKELLSAYPDNAIVYVEADHGQNPYQANYINKTNETYLPYDGEDIDFNDFNDDFDNKDVTAINIS